MNTETKKEDYTGIEVLSSWLDVTKASFTYHGRIVNQSSDKTPEEKAEYTKANDLTIQAVDHFQENAIPALSRALEHYGQYCDLQLVKVRNNDLMATEDEIKCWTLDRDFCKIMLKGRDNI